MQTDRKVKPVVRKGTVATGYAFYSNENLDIHLVAARVVCILGCPVNSIIYTTYNTEVKRRCALIPPIVTIPVRMLLASPATEIQRLLLIMAAHS